MAVYGYIRVSTKTQVDDGLSIDAQERQISGYAMMHGLEIAELFVEKAVSGWKPIENRPQGKRLTTVLSVGDIIICAKLDRMFRSAKDALVVSESFRQRGVSLHLLDLGGDVTGNGISKMFFTIVAAFAEFERDRIAERISDVKASERDKGRYLGGTRPFGFQIDSGGRLIPYKNEQALIVKVIEMKQRGISLRDIAHRITSEGSKISHVTVGKIIQENMP